MRSTFLLLFLAGVCLFSISGCSRDDQMEKKAPEEVTAAKLYFNLLRGGQYDQVETQFDPRVKDAAFRSDFDELVATIPPVNPSSVKAASVRRVCEGDSCDFHIILEYKYSVELLLFNVILRKTDGQSSILGMHIRVIPASLIKANEFTLSNRGFPQYAMFSLAILIPLLISYALVQCILSDIGPRKWAWAILILVGITRLGINWNTAEFDFKPLSIQILSAGGYQEMYEPWTIAISIPVGAIAFLVKYQNSEALKLSSIFRKSSAK